MIDVLAPLPVLLPLLGAGAALAMGRHPRVQRALSITVLTVVLCLDVVLLLLADRDGTARVRVGGWEEGIAIVLVVDRLSALMLVVAAVVLLGVLVYAVGQGTTDGDDETPISIFHPTYLVLSAGVSNAFLSGDLFNLYVGFEILLVASYVLLTLGGTGPRVQAGTTYVVVSLLSSLLFLAGIAYVYAAVGTLDLAEVARRMEDVPEGTRTAIQLVLLTAFGIKAAVFPLSAWLPDSYPTASAPVTAVFAGLLTKVGIYAILRLQTLVFPGERVQVLLLVAALLTMVVGVLGAVAQDDVKRLLSFTLVSHIGYMLMGIGLGSAVGLAGAVFYVAHHILVQTGLFLATGLVERRGRTSSMARLGGLATASPLLALLFFVPAMNLGGIPPLSGFLGKLALLQAGTRDGGSLAYVLVGASVVTSLLTLYAIAKVWSRAFWRPLDQAEPLPARGDRPVAGTSVATGTALRLMPPAMVGATAFVVGAGLLLTVLGGPLYRYAERTANDLLARGPYLGATR